MASGLGGLIGVGRTQKQQALSGLTKAAQLETQKDVANMQLEAQKEAAQMNVLGTVGGIGGAYMLASGGGASAAAGAGTAAGGAAASGGAMAALGAAAPWVLLAVAGGYLLKKIFD